MKIFIDSNIFFNSYFLKGPQFQLLSNFIKNTTNNLIVSEVVVLEVENKYKNSLQQIKLDLQKVEAKIGQFLDENIKLDRPEALDNNEYDFKKIILDKFPRTEILKVDNIDNNKLLRKAIHGIRPFRESEKGYRDSLIWESFLNYIKDNPAKENIEFISNNSTDFFNETKDKFHSDLLADLLQIGCDKQVRVHNSLNDFIESCIDKDLHAFFHLDPAVLDEKYASEIEKQLEFFAGVYINSLSAIKFLKHYENIEIFHEQLKLINNFIFEIIEGFEDGDIKKYSKVSDEEIYLECDFNLRVCKVKFEISLEDFFNNKNVFDGFFEEIEFSSETVYMYSYPRVYLKTKSILGLRDGMLDNIDFEIERIKPR